MYNNVQRCVSMFWPGTPLAQCLVVKGRMWTSTIAGTIDAPSTNMREMGDDAARFAGTRGTPISSRRYGQGFGSLRHFYLPRNVRPAG